ncbi:hypothetical protein [Pseudomonas sp. Pdm06]|uniref:hypothetical protein n=1 Tax=Pseudomonas sp. Pdm06 TaxID=1790044 RepID=UPI00177F61F8|nr:hypothetical protein [Pseudomonas sp. Pdm06]MBD9461638.1 hypothetical protein [Pseudomonas sp. Pdm06]
MSIKRPIGIVLALGLAFLVIKGISNNPPAGKASPEPDYPISDATYEQVNADVGCKSKFSDEKKEDIFNSKYKNHWMTWQGKAVIVEADKVALNVDGIGTQDISVTFMRKGDGYDLTKGSVMKVRFLMKSMGGCILPFGGVQALLTK